MPQREPKSETVTVSEWMLTILIMAIPLVNLVMVCVWAFGGGAPPSKANWAKATILWALIAIALYVVLALVFGVGLAVMGAANR